MILKKRAERNKDYTVSIIIPARNEEKNILNSINWMPSFGKKQELIFIEGHSKDKTWDEIQKVKKQNRTKFTIRSFKQKGIGKADAVRLGFDKAKGEILMILDADLTVAPSELLKFYRALSEGKGEFINGSRLIYPMEKQAMRFLNKIGNKFFSYVFTFILGQPFKDTLCGTKVLFKKDYLKIKAGRNYFGDFDPFGDYDLIFGAVKQNLKIIEMPVRYRERIYGQTNISRFSHGWLLLKMTSFAFRKFIFY
jgi:glycosyltransferase involved in cell wall biosynthesis